MTDCLLGIEALPQGEISVSTRQQEGDEAMIEPMEPVSKPTKRGTLPQSTSRTTDRVQPGSGALVMRKMNRNEKTRLLQELDENEVRGCRKCELCQSRTQTVFGDGDPDADLLFIGEGPGQTEDEQGIPFVGRAGELLNKMIEAIGLDRKTVYIANVVKCRPPNNRTPLAPEVDACADYLRRQIAIIQPRVIVTVGGPATKLILASKLGITRLRGTWHAYTQVEPAIPVMPTFHPAYLLRAYTKENRAKVWSDLQAAQAKLKE